MRLRPTPIPGLLELLPTKHADNRGFFARLWDDAALAAQGIDFRPSQISVSHNIARHTLRGMHWQADPHGETKLVRASRGRAYDVAIDLRPGSPTRLHWFATILDADRHNALLIPAGFAHGFLTLADNTELTYLIDVPHAPDSARGARWNDPAFAIAWPATPSVIAPRDATYPDLP